MSNIINAAASVVPIAPQPKEIMMISANDVLARAKHIQEIREKIMKPNVHFGKSFGTAKDSLWKAGAEVLCVAFGLAPKYQIEDLSTADEIRCRLTCDLYTLNGTFVASGVGEASTNETKYKWRSVVCEAEFDETDANRRRILYKKDKGSVTRIQQVRQEHADLGNTVLKMAAKRAYIAATLSATGASDMFEQDLEDLEENGVQLNRDGGGEPIFWIKSAEIKTGNKKAGGTYTKYVITTTDDQQFSTFHKGLYETALELKAANQPCIIRYKTGQYGNDLESIERTTVAPEPSATAAAATAPAAAVATASASDEVPSDTGGLLKFFGQHYKVYSAPLERKIGKPKEEWTDDDRSRLQSIGRDLLAGKGIPSDYFE